MTKPMIPAMLSFQGHSLSDDEKRLFRRYNPVGFNLFGRNIKNKSQLKKLINEIKELLERDDILFAIDQEGGRVRRLAEPEFRPYLPQYAFGDLYLKNKKEALDMAKKHACLISGDLREIGFNMNYAPVLDLAQEYTSPALKSRCFGSDEKIVSILGKTMINEYIKRCISPCIKHLPGHGRASVDPHLRLPIINTPLKELEKDFYPFIKNNNSPSGMTAHIVIPEIDDKLPITQSRKDIDYIIRGIIGFDGFLISDAIDMKALKGTIGEKTKASLQAGCDAVCYALGKFEELIEICDNCSIINDKSQSRFEKIKSIVGKVPNFKNIKDISQKYEEKAGGIELYNDSYDATEVLNKLRG
ncbi:MAG: hypothetical protein LBR70_04585 [Lactobacillaceae bacterium]|jgi:beta-N-acetylhexosaminidase|nr:hypothetical protein [Lactobacillaceae bacterium]